MMCPEQAIIGHAAFGDGPLPLYDRYHDGALAEYLRVPYWLVDPLPSTVSFEVGAKLNHFAAAARAIKCANLAPGATVVVTAATGSIGSATVTLARSFGLARLILVGRKRERLNAVAGLAEGVVSDIIATDDLPDDWTTTQGLTRSLRELVPSGADAVIDYTPTGPTAGQATAALATGGTLVHLGANETPLPVSLHTMVVNCWRIVGIRGSTRADTDQVLTLLGAGAFSGDELITHRYPLTEADRAIEAIQERAHPMWMVVVIP